jgi:hypothetical protein
MMTFEEVFEFNSRRQRFETTEILEKSAIKRNLLRLVLEHRQKCSGEECRTGLYWIYKLAQRAGLKFNDEEQRLFL